MSAVIRLPACLKADQFAFLAGLSVATVRRKVRARIIAAASHSGTIRINPRELLKFGVSLEDAAVRLHDSEVAWRDLSLSGRMSRQKEASLRGCSAEEFRAKIEAQFHSGMSWDNYRMHWEYDHVIPSAAFDKSNIDHQRLCAHWANIRPSLVHQNRVKNCRLPANWRQHLEMLQRLTGINRPIALIERLEMKEAA